MRVVYFGTPEFAVPSLEAVLAAGHEVALVVTRPDAPAGRHMRLTPPPVAELALRRGLPLAQPERLGVDEFVAKLGALDAEVAAVVAFGRLITPRVLRLLRHGFVNVHPSLLPRHRGPSPIETAILAGDEETGVTTMLLDEGMDTGPLLLQRRTAIDPREHTVNLEPRLAALGAGLLVETLDGIARGSLRARPQDNRLATVTEKLDRRMGRIDWTLPAALLSRRCRALDPWPGLYCNFRGSRVKIHGLVAASASGDQPPGTVLAVAPEGISVRCGQGSVALLTELQREGKRRLPADAFILGERVVASEQFR